MIAFFNKEYLKENLLDKGLSVIVKNSSFFREKSDYDDFFVASRKDAEKQTADARVFLEAIQSYLNSV